jgi:hypothetical protein
MRKEWAVRVMLTAIALSLGLVPLTAPVQPESAAVDVYTTTLTISTYPYADYLETHYSAAYNIYYPWLDRAAYDASGPVPAPHDYTAVIAENAWLRLTFLPELGGRLYGIEVKSTGEQLLYQNPVIKPTHWGPPDDNWWLAAGGIEWCLPVEEHGYEWAVPWGYSYAATADGATVTLWDSLAGDRIRARIGVYLPADQAAFQITPRLENPTAVPVAFKFWHNAMLAPGAANTVGSELRFVVPVDQATVHSTGDDRLPGAGLPMDWPVHGGVDFSRLGNWDEWLGFFARPQAAQDWTGVYAEGIRRGVARVFPHGIAVGVKGFGFGWAHPIDWHEWTDDGSTYVELHGGPSPTFWDTMTLDAGGALEWTETWLPVGGLPALSGATAEMALGLKAAGSDLRLGLQAAGQQDGLSLWLWRASDCGLLWRKGGLSLAPGEAYAHELPGLGLGADEAYFAVYSGDTLVAAAGEGTCLPTALHQVFLPLVIRE